MIIEIQPPGTPIEEIEVPTLAETCARLEQTAPLTLAQLRGELIAMTGAAYLSLTAQLGAGGLSLGAAFSEDDSGGGDLQHVMNCPTVEHLLLSVRQHLGLSPATTDIEVSNA